jgi:hypothetical protein
MFLLSDDGWNKILMVMNFIKTSFEGNKKFLLPPLLADFSYLPVINPLCSLLLVY